MSSPPPPSLPSSQPLLSTITIPKGAVGLGLRIGGGIGQVYGPHIVIDKIMEGSDAAKVRRLRNIHFYIIVSLCTFQANDNSTSKELTSIKCTITCINLFAIVTAISQCGVYVFVLRTGVSVLETGFCR